MRILLAPDKFKGCLSATLVCAAMAEGIRRSDPAIEIDSCPLSDGGEGFVDAIVSASKGRLSSADVCGPLPERRVRATYGSIDNGTTAVIEMSQAAGLELLAPSERNPLYTTTFGVGELIRRACAEGCKNILLGIGGSATCDAGVGCLQACGCHITLASGEYASPGEPLCGQDLDQIVRIKSGRGSPVDGARIVIACDVRNPLLGPNGTAYVYGPQKGASSADVVRLDAMLKALATRCGWTDLVNRPGAGAAGGIGVGLMALFGATMSRGFEIVRDATELSDRIARADLVLTGEGKIDAQTAQGKVVAGVSELALRLGKRCVAVAGKIDDASGLPLDHAIELNDPDTSGPHAAELIAARVAEYLARR